MAVNPVANTYNAVSTTDRNPKSQLGKDDFLKILVTQLQNQDPMNPVEDTAFIAQMAQFSSLEQMSSLNSSFEMTRAFSLIGKMVNAEVKDGDSVQVISGKVNKVSMADGQIYATVNSTKININDIKDVFTNTNEGVI